MLLKVVHRTCYHYSLPVYLEPFTVRLRPRCDATQSLRSYRIHVTPAPSGIAHCIGLDGNNTETIWFSDMHRALSIEVQTLVETHHGDAFNFLVTDPAALRLPVKYDSRLAPGLDHYLVRCGDDARVAAFAQEMMRAAKQETIPFLTLLAETIPKRFEYMLREHGDPWTPEETMKQGRGSCRDFAMLFIDICRSAGIAARFVSGYCIGDVSADSDMHAWAEVFLPGAGWRGFDPSRGLSTSDDYIAVAAGQSPQDAAPTFGSFRGEAVSTLEAEISISLPDDADTIT
ncbi:MAG: transglutaminase family protein [Burkholderiales bacterium]|nr:transglutaminase family protein [Burkholderiales bacterium]MCJ7838930.1 transglutaminase family protein [Burkholderiales bacterium]